MVDDDGAAAVIAKPSERYWRPYLGLEVRRDLIAEAASVARWADTLALIIEQVRDSFPILDSRALRQVRAEQGRGYR